MAMNSSKSKSRKQAHVRMYRQGLGDCFLVRLPKSGGEDTFNMLIDCGIISVAPGAKATMQKVVADIAETCGNHLDLVVVTHEHWDHVSGFSTQQAQDDFDNIDIDEVWYAWTEDPANKLGKKLRAERAAKVNALQAAAVALRGTGSEMGMERAERVESILQFFGVESTDNLNALAATGKDAASGKTRNAFDYLNKRRGVKVRFCHPDNPPTTLSGVEGVRAYVLGPPEDERLLKRSAPTKKGKEVYEFASDIAMDANLAAAFERLGGTNESDDGLDCPFEWSMSVYPNNESPKLQKLKADTWNRADSAWRKIELDWTASAETLALNLDSHTNNTCLVVALELVDSGQVLLFAGDAQVGNWLSWQDTKWSLKDGNDTQTVTGPDLLQRTAFYKVGHHGSHNATLRALGLEQMTSDNLVAFIPVSKAQAMKNRWREMPFEPLVKRLREKTGGRLVISDPDQKAPTKESLDGLTKGQKAAFMSGLTTDPLFYEYSFSL
ncbi:MAG: MBL fold metallo-hydrolase [Sideroxyarcus sp.]